MNDWPDNLSLNAHIGVQREAKIASTPVVSQAVNAWATRKLISEELCADARAASSAQPQGLEARGSGLGFGAPSSIRAFPSGAGFGRRRSPANSRSLGSDKEERRQFSAIAPIGP